MGAPTSETRRLGPDWSPEHLSGLPPVVQAVLWRRSFRTYEPDPLTDAQRQELQRVAHAVPSLEGRRSGWVELITEPDERRRTIAALTSGIIGRTNTWLRTIDPGGIFLVFGDETRSIREGGRWYYNVDAALAGQAAVLTAADLRLGTCWMAAIDEKSCQRELALPPGRRVVAAIPVGRPRARQALDLSGIWDRLARRLVSSRRRPASEIHSLERFDSPEKLPSARLEDWTWPSSGKAVARLVEELRPWAEVSGPAPSDEKLAWLLELCRQAPTADNSQIWRLVFVREPAAVSRVLTAAIRGRSDLAPLADQSPGCVVVFSAAPFIIRHRTQEQPFALIDVPIGVLHVLLGAEEMGLAWNVLFLFSHTSVGRAVGIPPNQEVVALVLLGERGRGRGEETPWTQIRRTPRGSRSP